jgi:mono/diheme cytochrome c family protein
MTPLRTLALSLSIHWRTRALIAAVLLTLGSCDEATVAPPLCPEDVDHSAGEALFQTQCAPCHGADGLGATSHGIIHELHHSDAELIQVMLNGMGAMPPVNITDAEAAAIVDYMRCAL